MDGWTAQRSFACATALAAALLTACNSAFGIGDLDFDAGPSTTTTASSGGGGTAAGGMGGSNTGGGGSGGAILVTVTLGESSDAMVTGVTTDTTLAEEAATANYGGATDIHTDTSRNHVALLRIDLASIPAQAVVMQASLRLWTTDCGACQLMDGVVELRALTMKWDEGDVDGVAGVANWTEAQTGVAWDIPGAAGASVGQNVASFFPGAIDTAYDVALDTDVVDQWVGDPRTNLGVRIATTSPSGDGVGFWSSEIDTTEKRPLLTVVYEPP